MANLKLDDAQRKKVTQWIHEGHKLSEIQKQLETEFGLRVTYLDVRLLVDDLKLTPKDPVLPKEIPPPAEIPSVPAEPAPQAEAAPGAVSVTIDELARPGSAVSGKVTFRDGNRATWYLDQMGRLGVAPDVAGYKPPQQDIVDFQALLQTELAKMGF